MRKFSLLLLSAVSLVGSPHAEAPWSALLPQMTASMMETPEGDFSAHKVAVVDNGFVNDHVELKSALD